MQKNFIGLVVALALLPAAALGVSSIYESQTFNSSFQNYPISFLNDGETYGTSLVFTTPGSNIIQTFPAKTGTVANLSDIPWQFNGAKIYYESGNVGIGTTNPQRALHVNGLIQIGGIYASDYTLTFSPSDINNGAGIFAVNAGSYQPITIDASKFIFRANGESEKTLYVDTTGKVGIGTTNPTSALYVVGNVSADSFTDRTPGFTGAALPAILNIKNNPDGSIDHSTLPEFARTTIIKSENATSTAPGGAEIKEIKEEGRSLGAMISILTKGMQELQGEILNLQNEVGKMEIELKN